MLASITVDDGVYCVCLLTAMQVLVWVDPLDGTSEFTEGIFGSAVNFSMYTCTQ